MSNDEPDSPIRQPVIQRGGSGGPEPSTWWPRWSGALLAVVVACAVVIRVGSGFGYVALFQIMFVVPWLAPVLFGTAFLKRRAQATTDPTLRRVLLAGMVALLLSAVGIEQHPNEECLLFTCRENSADRVWWSEVDWLFRVETALIASVALLVIAIAALSRRERTAS